MNNSRRKAPYNYRAFFGLEFGYVILLLLGYATHFSDASKALANLYAVFMLMRVILCLTSGFKRLPGRDVQIMFGVFFLFFINLVVNVTSTNFLDALKIISIFLFYLAGKSVHQRFFERRPRKIYVTAFVLLPVIISIVDMLFRAGSGGDLVGDTSVAFFSNRNNAVLFSVVTCWLLILANTNRWLILIYIVACALVFKTLGALVAVAVAVYIVYFGLNVFKIAIFGVIFAGLYLVFGSDFSILDRVTTATSGIRGALSVSGGVEGLGQMNYGQIAQAAGTSDISLIFRLKHWLNILQIYSSGSIWHQMFGFGVDSSLVLTDLNLLPHNDYLRFFFELGPGIFVAFIALNALIVWRMGRTLLMIPAIFVFIYSFSENIINNFLVMSLFYFMAGAISVRRPKVGRYITPKTEIADEQ